MAKMTSRFMGMSEIQQPPREPCDGQVSVNRHKDELCISVTHNGQDQGLVMSEYNAWRVFGMLAMLLGVSLPKKIAKAIKM
jgi:hypothetical protein